MIETAQAQVLDNGDLWWVGVDDRGVELEIAARSVTDLRTGEPIWLVIHVMPTDLRRK